ncbi:ABC transporter permease [Saccharibacillus endophyticus]|uniref:Peptide ABC transporter permease n=1 Tax=Saccharibacillus endophyticus TaxID=2060666 RepID=A0ABQ1ZS19_9BACL|nr:ABC transporter permease [Saccharibacillus endophyticus]GGH73691.1 peptide ABC transporter permease [Saccharibacillus endophyticus]
MGRRLLVAVLQMLMTVFVASLVLFALIRLAPGDPAKLLIGRTMDIAWDAAAYESTLNELRQEMGLNGSLFSQYASWIGSLLQLDLGTSFYTDRSVAAEIGERLPSTFLLAGTALIIQMAIGLFIGILSAVHSGTWFDTVVRLLCVGLASVPGFVIGLVLLLALAVQMGFYEISSQATLSRLWLPALTMGLLGAPQVIRVVRANLLGELGQVYIQSALSRGLSSTRVVWHAMRNVLLPTITLTGLSFTSYISGAVVIESIFAWPGLGEYALNGILHKDYPALQGYALVMVLSVVVIHLMVEALYVWLDPRMTRRKKEAVHE